MDRKANRDIVEIHKSHGTSLYIYTHKHRHTHTHKVGYISLKKTCFPVSYKHIGSAHKPAKHVLIRLL